jgi:hypothetical protein
MAAQLIDDRQLASTVKAEVRTPHPGTHGLRRAPAGSGGDQDRRRGGLGGLCAQQTPRVRGGRIRSLAYDLPGDTAESRLLALIDALNHDPAVDGILVQLPNALWITRAAQNWSRPRASHPGQ